MKQLAKVIGSFICFLLVLSPVALCQMQAGSEPAQAAAVARGAIWKENTSGHAGSAGLLPPQRRQPQVAAGRRRARVRCRDGNFQPADHLVRGQRDRGNRCVEQSAL